MPGNRAESIRVLLESAKLGSSEHAALLLVQSLEDQAKPIIEKLRLLWCTPRVAEVLAQWNLKDWEGYLIFFEDACKKDWEGLDSTSVNKIYSLQCAVWMWRRRTSPSVLQSLYDEYIKIHDLKTRH